jgi:hypothetical protein
LTHQAQKCHELEYTSYHPKSQNLTHGGGWEGQNLAKSISKKSTQSSLRKGHEEDKVHRTDSKGLQTGYLGRLHAPRKELTKV